MPAVEPPPAAGDALCQRRVAEEARCRLSEGRVRERVREQDVVSVDEQRIGLGPGDRDHWHAGAQRQRQGAAAGIGSRIHWEQVDIEGGHRVGICDSGRRPVTWIRSRTGLAAIRSASARAAGCPGRPRSPMSAQRRVRVAPLDHLERADDDVKVLAERQVENRPRRWLATSCRARCRKRVGPIDDVRRAGRLQRRYRRGNQLPARLSRHEDVGAGPHDRELKSRGERSQGQIRSISPEGCRARGQPASLPVRRFAVWRRAARPPDDLNRDARRMRPAYWITMSEMLRRFVGRSPQRSRVATAGQLLPPYVGPFRIGSAARARRPPPVPAAAIRWQGASSDRRRRRSPESSSARAARIVDGGPASRWTI